MQLKLHIAFLCWGVLLLGACGDKKGDNGNVNPDQSIDNSFPANTYMNHGPEAKYVGKQACKSCHPGKFESYLKSEMGRSWKPATFRSSAARFDHVNAVYDEGRNMHYLPRRKGEELFIYEFRLEGKDTVYRREEKIDYIVGSGQHTNSHLMETGGYLYQMPMTWYAQEEKWDLPPGFENGANSRFEREIALECVSCHNALPDFVEGSHNQFVSIPEGIDCERCHGPGSIHIERMKQGLEVDISSEIDWSIVNPGKLPLDLQFDLCQRCHLQGTAIPQAGKSFSDFRPGMPLKDFINVFLPRYEDSLKNFIMASHPDRLRMSQCFIASHKKGEQGGPKPMTCISCHNPHFSFDTYAEDTYNSACGSCHFQETDLKCDLPKLAQLEEPRGCVGCHMPRISASDIPHVRITDHFIRKPDVLSEVEVEKQKRFFRLVCRTDAKATGLTMALGYLNYFEQKEALSFLLDSAAALLKKAPEPASDLRRLQVDIHLQYLREDFQALLQALGNTDLAQIRDAWTLYRIGEAYTHMGQKTQALQAYQLAVEQAPKHLKFRNKMAASLIGKEDLLAAEKLLNEILPDQPDFAPAVNNRGYLYLLKGTFGPAETDFLQALALDPDAELPLANLASLYLNTGRKAQGLPYAKRLIALNPENEQYHLLLNVLRVRP